LSIEIVHQLFKVITDKIKAKIERSVYNRRKRRCFFLTIEEIEENYFKKTEKRMEMLFSKLRGQFMICRKRVSFLNKSCLRLSKKSTVYFR